MGNSLSDLLTESKLRTNFEIEFLQLSQAYTSQCNEDRTNLAIQFYNHIMAEANIHMRVMMILFISNITTEEARNDLIQWLYQCNLLNFKNTSDWQIKGVAAPVPVIGEQQYDWLLGELKGGTSLENAEWLSASLNEQTGKPEWPLTVTFRY